MLEAVSIGASHQGRVFLVNGYCFLKRPRSLTETAAVVQGEDCYPLTDICGVKKKEKEKKKTPVWFSLSHVLY